MNANNEFGKTIKCGKIYNQNFNLTLYIRWRECKEED